MHLQDWYTQHQTSGKIGRTLEGIASLLQLPGYTQFRAAIAYATLSGCKILEQRVRTSATWRRSKKRWLISIDFGRTEPRALDFLARLQGAEVRIPNGYQVVARKNFSPVTPFHPKAYSVDDITDGDGHVYGIFLGSGNLSASGLLTGSESGVLNYWVDASRSQLKAMIGAYQQMQWFDAAWEVAEPLEKIISEYKKRWKKSKPRFTDEDKRIVDLYMGGAGRVISGKMALELNSAKALWVEVVELYKNRGPREAGNQVDLPRGSRVFFGFTPRSVQRNTVFGQSLLKNAGFDGVRCSVRFGNNYMDKVNLPVPGAEGPPSYDNSILLFERAGFAEDGAARFQIQVGNEIQLKRWKKTSVSVSDLKMRSGRRYGFLY